MLSPVATEKRAFSKGGKLRLVQLKEFGVLQSYHQYSCKSLMSLLQMSSTSFVLSCCSVLKPQANTPWAALATLCQLLPLPAPLCESKDGRTSMKGASRLLKPALLGTQTAPCTCWSWCTLCPWSVMDFSTRVSTIMLAHQSPVIFCD